MAFWSLWDTVQVHQHSIHGPSQVDSTCLGSAIPTTFPNTSTPSLLPFWSFDPNFSGVIECQSDSLLTLQCF
jgi:hypothetical protein